MTVKATPGLALKSSTHFCDRRLSSALVSSQPSLGLCAPVVSGGVGGCPIGASLSLTLPTLHSRCDLGRVQTKPPLCEPRITPLLDLGGSSSVKDEHVPRAFGVPPTVGFEFPQVCSDDLGFRSLESPEHEGLWLEAW